MKFLSLSLLVLGLAVVLTPFAAKSAEGGPVFLDNFDKAVAASKSSGKPLIAIFSASWCPPCQQMKKSVYPSKEAQPFHDAFVWAYLDADDRANQAVMSQFKVSGIPHVAFVSPDGLIMGHFTGAIPPKEFAEVLTQVLADAGKGGGSGTKPAGGSGTKQGAPQGSGAKQGSSTKR